MTPQNVGDRLYQISLLSALSPPSQSRAWQSAPHPALPIVATCSSDKAVRIYSLTSFNLLSTISGGHKRSVRTCAWKPGLRGESALATGSFDATIGVWRRDDSNGTADEGLKLTGNDAEGENDENRDEDEEWRFALVLEGHESEIKSVSWSTAGNFIATCSRDKSVWIWEEIGDDDFETIAVLQEHEGDVKCVAWHPEEELLASGSYDDDVRLWREDVEDWDCVAVLRGHESTVWCVEWEPAGTAKVKRTENSPGSTPIQDLWRKRREESGPRLVSCSDDMIIKVWRKRPKDKTAGQNPMSTIQSGSSTENWVEESELPKVHERAIYSMAWSKKTGRIVSTGGDGRMVVYEEKWREPLERTRPGGEAIKTVDSAAGVEGGVELDRATEWVVVAELDGAHDVFEVNHVCWAPRADQGKSSDTEEIIISTGDDGVVNTWTISDGGISNELIES